MKQVNTQVARIRYNLEFSGYEAMVFIEDNGTRFSYPSFVTAPLDADYGFIMQALATKARKAHRSAAPTLRGHTRIAQALPLAA